jgi:hypothetical protein
MATETQNEQPQVGDMTAERLRGFKKFIRSLNELVSSEGIYIANLKILLDIFDSEEVKEKIKKEDQILLSYYLTHYKKVCEEYDKASNIHAQEKGRVAQYKEALHALEVSEKAIQTLEKLKPDFEESVNAAKILNPEEAKKAVVKLELAKAYTEKAVAEVTQSIIKEAEPLMKEAMDKAVKFIAAIPVSPYIAGMLEYSEFTTFVNGLFESFGNFKDFVSKQLQEKNKQSYDSLAINLIQRLPRYELLFKEIKEKFDQAYLGANAESYEETVKTVLENAKHINLAKELQDLEKKKKLSKRSQGEDLKSEDLFKSIKILLLQSVKTKKASFENDLLSKGRMPDDVEQAKISNLQAIIEELEKCKTISMMAALHAPSESLSSADPVAVEADLIRVQLVSRIFDLRRVAIDEFGCADDGCLAMPSNEERQEQARKAKEAREGIQSVRIARRKPNASQPKATEQSASLNKTEQIDVTATVQSQPSTEVTVQAIRKEGENLPEAVQAFIGNVKNIIATEDFVSSINTFNGKEWLQSQITPYLSESLKNEVQSQTVYDAMHDEIYKLIPKLGLIEQAKVLNVIESSFSEDGKPRRKSNTKKEGQQPIVQHRPSNSLPVSAGTPQLPRRAVTQPVSLSTQEAFRTSFELTNKSSEEKPRFRPELFNRQNTAGPRFSFSSEQPVVIGGSANMDELPEVGVTSNVEQAPPAPTAKASPTPLATTAYPQKEKTSQAERRPLPQPKVGAGVMGDSNISSQSLSRQNSLPGEKATSIAATPNPVRPGLVQRGSTVLPGFFQQDPNQVKALAQIAQIKRQRISQKPTAEEAAESTESKAATPKNS